jgi:hypothetical protein
VKAKRAVSNLGILLGSADGLLLRLANRPGVVSELLFKILALPCARKHLALRKQAPPTKSSAREGEEIDEALADEPFSKWIVSQVKDIPEGAERIIGKFSALSSVIEAVKILQLLNLRKRIILLITFAVCCISCLRGILLLHSPPSLGWWIVSWTGHQLSGRPSWKCRCWRVFSSTRGLSTALG